MLTVASIHIPKTAGTSFRRVLEGWFGKSLGVYYPEQDAVSALVDSTRAYHGHFTQQETPRAKLAISVVREPVARVVSHYHYWRNVPSGPHPEELHAAVRSGLSLEEFAQAIPNLQTRFVHDPDALAWLGRVESLDEDLRMLAGLLNKPCVRVPRDNVTPSYSAPSRAQEALIRSCNADDVELWRIATERALGVVV